MMEKTEFQQKLLQYGIDGMMGACIAVGTRLRLFEALAKVGNQSNPATPAQVADESGCKERYVREWLAALGTGGIISVTEDEKFFIKQEDVKDLTCTPELLSISFLPNFLRPYEKLCSVIKKEGPPGLDYADYTTECFEVIDRLSEALHKDHLVTDFIPALGPDMKERLEKGKMLCLDIGCGKGLHAFHLAQCFPNSKFIGIDSSFDAIRLAKKRRDENSNKIDNLYFMQMNGSKMDPSWNNAFDMAMIFDACHDQTRPDLCMKEIYRVLKPGGVFGMVEIHGTSSIYQDKKEDGAMAAMYYGYSLLHCLPVGSNSEDALCLGAMWGDKRGLELLKDAGFSEVTVQNPPYLPHSALYICKK
ncbi:unnamed protein product [Cylicocyclus nassatus]|uniref:Methyltransferase domain-containing protein n=1 Tax=Cylicocyclus nassatus TaxID=53992 RepID=A0AA36GGI8_CYLNA|nr:unnamed protein product [Cylicocyclus nassatus]